MAVGKTLLLLSIKHSREIEGIEHDEDGYWIYLRDGFVWDGSHTIHEDTVRECLSQFSLVKPENISVALSDADFMVSMSRLSRSVGRGVL